MKGWGCGRWLFGNLLANEVIHDVHQDEVEERDVSTKDEHRDQDDFCGVTKFLEFAKAFFVGIPWPLGLGEFPANFADKDFEFGEHIKSDGLTK